MTAAWSPRSGRTPNWARHYDETVDRHGPLLTAAVGRCLTGIWTPTAGLMGRHRPGYWASRAPLLLDFEGLRLEFGWNGRSRSVGYADVDPANLADPADPTAQQSDSEPWHKLGDAPADPADLVALTGQRLWAVDLIEANTDELDLGFAFGGGYLAMTTDCCCTLVLVCGRPAQRQLRLAAAGPTRDGLPPRGVPAPCSRPTWPASGTDPASVWAGRSGGG